MAINLEGSIDLMKLVGSGICTLKGRRCFVALVDENDLFVRQDETTGKARSCYLSVNICERKEPSPYGKTHYARQHFGKDFLERIPEPQRRERGTVYLGDFKPFTFGGNASQTVAAPVVEVAEEEESNLPF